VRKLADGRVFTAVDAKNLGLVDQIAYEDQCEQILAELFGCKPEEIYFDHYNDKVETFRGWLRCGLNEVGRGMMEGVLPVESKAPQYRW
jgi:ClpP class serine protease